MPSTPSELLWPSLLFRCRTPALIGRDIVRLLAAVLLFALAGNALANKPTNISVAERALLPEYCLQTQSFELRGTPDAPTIAQQHLIALMGRTLWDLHHYCWALVNIHRADGTFGSPAQKRYLQQWAINDCFYVIQKAPSDFILLPEIHTRVGDLYVALDRVADALPQYERAKALKPDYWPPYVRLADINIAIGRRQAAIDLLEEGLRLMPHEPKISEALARIKGGGATAERVGSSRP